MQPVPEQEAEEFDAHYLKQVTALGDHREVVAAEAIQSRSGIKLVNAGTSINGDLLDRLLHHKLLKPIDLSLTVNDGVDVALLLSKARTLREIDPYVSAMFADLRDPGAPLAALGRVVLTPALMVKLTVAQEQTPERLNHALKVALCAVIVGTRCRLGPTELDTLAAAGLFHDLGELHLDPAIFTGGPLSEAERRQVDAHPLVAYALLRHFAIYHPQVSRPVLEHHERLDGSGYPKGLTGARLSRSGRLLALAEFAVSVCERKDCSSVATTLKLHRRQFDEEAVKALFAMLEAVTTPAVPETPSSADAISARLQALARGVAVWEDAASALAEPALQSDLVEDVVSQLGEVRYSLARCGFALNAFESKLELVRDDAETVAELEVVASELLRRLKDIAWQAQRRCRAEHSADEALAPVERWCKRVFALLDEPAAADAAS